MHEDEHEEEYLQSDDETAMKVMINETSTLLSDVTTGKAPTEGVGSQETSECSQRPPFTLRSGFSTDRQRKERRTGMEYRCMHPEGAFA